MISKGRIFDIKNKNNFDTTRICDIKKTLLFFYITKYIL